MVARQVVLLFVEVRILARHQAGAELRLFSRLLASLMVVHQSLDLIVKVRILVGQPNHSFDRYVFILPLPC